jgi:predicted dehydrogenase
MQPVRLAIVGLGNMGRSHVRNMEEGKVPGIAVAALVDTDPAALEPYAAKYTCHRDVSEALARPDVEAVLVATPHYGHTTIGIAALNAGKHLLVEKPISVHRADCERLIAAYEARPRKEQVFAAMFNQRTTPVYRKVRALIQAGELGAIRRFNWIITDWFRTESYYRSGGWRATWGGEGGGVLLNQCPHQLDLLWWLMGQPETVQAHCRFGQWHDIEVEDDVTAYLRWPGGATGVFITTTGEAPGTNRLEIVGDRGRLVVDGLNLTFTRNEVPMDEACRSFPGGFTKPAVWNCQIPVDGGWGGQHNEILNNFAKAVRGLEPVLAPANEGIHSVELANAMLLSTWSDGAVRLPIDAALYERLLGERRASSRYAEKVKQATQRVGAGDMAASFKA